MASNLDMDGRDEVVFIRTRNLQGRSRNPVLLHRDKKGAQMSFTEKTYVCLPSLSDLEKLELQEYLKGLPPEDFEFQKQTIPADFHGEPATLTLVIILTPAAIAALSAWLLKNRETEKFKKTIKIRHPDGTIETEVVSYKRRTSVAPEIGDIKQLAKIFRVPIQFIIDLL